MRVQTTLHEGPGGAAVTVPWHVVRALGLRPGDDVIIDVERAMPRPPAMRDPAPPRHLQLEEDRDEPWAAYLAV